jgi:hypothetical protein
MYGLFSADYDEFEKKVQSENRLRNIRISEEESLSALNVMLDKNAVRMWRDCKLRNVEFVCHVEGDVTDIYFDLFLKWEPRPPLSATSLTDSSPEINNGSWTKPFPASLDPGETRISLDYGSKNIQATQFGTRA